MRILYDNKLLKASSIIPSNEDAQYGVANLLNHSLSMKYRTSNTNAPIVDIEWDNPVYIDCIALADSNVEYIDLKLYDDLNVEVFNKRLYIEFKSDVLYLDEMVYVLKASITLKGRDDYLEVGYMSLGQFFQMPNPLIGYSENIIITDERKTTKLGHLYSSKGTFLQTYEPSFRMVPYILMHQIKNIMQEVKNSRPLFVDMLEEAHYLKQPLLASFEMDSFEISRDASGRDRGSFSLKIVEVK